MYHLKWRSVPSSSNHNTNAHPGRVTSSGDMRGHKLANEMYATKLKMLVLVGLTEHQNSSKHEACCVM